MAENLSIFDISGRAMSAQLVRLNTTASNLANAGTVSGSEGTAFRSMKPVFRTVMGEAGKATVQVDRIDSSKSTPVKRYEPDHPLADKDGKESAVTVLGAWDSTPETKTVSYLSEVGKALVGREVGDTVQIRDEVTEVMETLTIRAIRPFNP